MDYIWGSVLFNDSYYDTGKRWNDNCLWIEWF